MVQKSLPSVTEYPSKLGPRIRGAHIHNPDRFNSWLRRVGPKEARGLAALDTAPELTLGRDNEMLVEHVGVGSDLHPLAAPGNHRENSGSRCYHPHIVLQLRHVFLSRCFLRERPGQHELTLEDRITVLDPASSVATIQRSAGCRTRF